MTIPACKTDTPSRGAAACNRPGTAGLISPHPERSARVACDFSVSHALQGGVLLMTALSILVLILSRLPWAVVLLAVPLILIFAFCEWRRVMRYEGRISTGERRWYWQATGGAKREFLFCGELTLWRWLIVINGRDLAGRRLRLILCRDGAPADDWRRLLVALRYSR